MAKESEELKGQCEYEFCEVYETKWMARGANADIYILRSG